jgi:hypothetical protein
MLLSPDPPRLGGFVLVAVHEPILRRLLVLIVLIVPSHPGADLFEADIT